MLPYVNEYIFRKEMATLGYTSDLDSEDSDKLEIFHMISQQLNKLQDEERKRTNGRK